MNQTTQALEHASVRQYCKVLRMPVIGSNFVRLSEQATKGQRIHIGYLEALLTMEAEERDRHAIQKRIRDAKLPRLKTLEEFDFNQAHQIPAAKIRELAEGGNIERAEPVVFNVAAFGQLANLRRWNLMRLIEVELFECLQPG